LTNRRRLKAARFSIDELRVSNNDHLVTYHRESGSRAVQTDDAEPAGASIT